MTSKVEKTYLEFVEDALGIADVDDFLDKHNALQLEYMRAFFEEYGEFLTEGNYALYLNHFRMVPELVAAASDLANCRAEEYNTRAMIKQVKDRIAETEDGIYLEGLEADLKQIRAEKEAATKTLQDQSVAAYMASLQEKPLPGVEIKKMNVVTVHNWQEAEEWAVHNARFLLTLDRKQFERLVRDFDVVPPEIAELETESKPYISTNLQRYITPVEKEEE